MVEDDEARLEGFAPARFTPGFLDHGGPYWLKPAEGRTLVGLRMAPHHMNYRDMAHGGVLTTLADVALSYQAFASEDPPVPVATASLTTNFLAPARLGDWLVADARIDRIGGRSAHVSGRIARGGETLATMSGVFTLHRKGA
ncbi:PaaI family thioesterase [Altererythrobacter sp. H2]|uniref:PaaI family thioesterase n=1 Tax=Altererythrobacter sp. H2 TaxID=3108391 RepID=UPI002B4BFFD1|nr:PaaI family thioesterase [Altererythrobacter sp. H2]WRK96232.1 PaaI family thioesterase [Altererythrobacter sp. H2]